MNDVKCEGICYDCPNKGTTDFCTNEEKKYEIIIQTIKRANNEWDKPKFWINVDWEIKDVVAMKAWKRAVEWLNDNGYDVSSVSYKEWIRYDDKGNPWKDCGYHTGTAYIRKMNKKKQSEDIKTEYILCAAISIPVEGKEEPVVIGGYRHSSCFISALNLECISYKTPYEDGFITSTGRFVDCKEAKEIARNANQLLREPLYDELMSEDIY